MPEFAALMAFMIAIVALSIDIMLPVIDVIGEELGAKSDNAPQLIISMLFLGLSLGQLVYGPVSDTLGRKPMIFLGFFIFIIGTILCMMAESFNALLIGRFLQGFGGAGPRIVSNSVIRDLYHGRAMAQVTSVIMGFFILVPAIAPALGQAIYTFLPWRWIFVVLLLQAVLVSFWFWRRQEETLKPEYEKPFSLITIGKNVWEILNTRESFWYTMAAGIIFGAFVSYLLTSPQIFEDAYGITDKFPYYFGGLAIVIGSASLFNARLVMKLGMRRLCLFAVSIQCSISSIVFIYAWLHGGHVPLIVFMGWAVIAFFMMGFLFGNFNAIALEPLGHIAGIGAAMVGSISTFVSMGIGTLIGQAYNHTVLPMIGGYAVLGFVSLLVMKWADRGHIPSAS